MMNLLPKRMIITNIVETLKKDPETGVVKLLQTARSHVKSANDQALLSQVINYYQASSNAKMQIRSLVFNSSYQSLTTFAEAIYEALKPPVSVNFLKFVTIDEVAATTGYAKSFYIIDLKDLSLPTCEIMNRLKADGQIFFVTITVTAENYATVTADEMIVALIRNGVRAIFYRLSSENQTLEVALIDKINQIRSVRPILAFYLKKNAPPSETSTKYIINEQVNGKEYQLHVKL